MSERDHAATLARFADQDEPLLTLTDQELHVLAGVRQLEGPAGRILGILNGTWPSVIVVRRFAGVTRTQLLLNLDDRLVLLQDMCAQVHRFWVLRPPTACQHLAVALDPTGRAVDGPEADRELLRAPSRGCPPDSWAPLRQRMDHAPGAARLFARRSEHFEPRELLLEFASLDDGVVMVSGQCPDASGEATEIVARRVSRTAVSGIAVHALGLIHAVA